MSDNETMEVTPLLALVDAIGDGEVLISPEFVELNSLSKADLLQDWIHKLQEMYDSVTDGTFLQDLGATGINQPPASDRVN